MRVPRSLAGLVAPVSPLSPRALALVAALALAAPGIAHAQLGRLKGAGSLSYDLDYVRVRQPDTSAGETLQWVAAGVGLRGFVSAGAVGYGVGVDFRLGGGLSGGFGYEFDLYPVGAGVRLGRHGMFGIVAGAGVSGLTGTLEPGDGGVGAPRLPFAVQFPVEAFAEFQLGARIHVAAAASARWLVADEFRQAGAPSLPLGDELTATVKLRWNHRHDVFRMRTGNGYFVAALYQERLGARFIGAAIGYSISAWSLR